MAATVMAVVVKNSPLAEAYQSLLLLEGEIRIGSLGIQKPLLLCRAGLCQRLLTSLLHIAVFFALHNCR